MLILRIIAILAVLGIGSSIAAWMLTREMRYLALAWRIGKAALIVALMLMAVLAAERIIVL
jgi:hypothetical protein